MCARPENVPTKIMAQGTFYIIVDITFIVRKGGYFNKANAFVRN